MSDSKPAEHELIVCREDLLALQNMPPIPVAIDGPTALFIMSALQLATRHPGLNGPVLETVVEFARGLQDRISITPSLEAICEAGWNPAEDRPAKEPVSGLILPGDPGFAL